jgi:hypothetical protein
VTAAVAAGLAGAPVTAQPTAMTWWIRRIISNLGVSVGARMSRVSPVS